MKTLEQKTETEDDLPDMLMLLFLCIKHESRTYCDAHRSNAGYIECNQDTCDCCTDVGTEDYSGRLRKIHNSGINESHGHYSCCRRRLNAHRYEHTDKEAHHGNAGQLLEKVFHFRTGCELKTFTHVMHAKKEGAKASE